MVRIGFSTNATATRISDRSYHTRPDVREASTRDTILFYNGKIPSFRDQLSFILWS